MNFAAPAYLLGLLYMLLLPVQSFISSVGSSYGRKSGCTRRQSSETDFTSLQEGQQEGQVPANPPLPLLCVDHGLLRSGIAHTKTGFAFDDLSIGEERGGEREEGGGVGGS